MKERRKALFSKCFTPFVIEFRGSILPILIESQVCRNFFQLKLYWCRLSHKFLQQHRGNDSGHNDDKYHRRK